MRRLPLGIALTFTVLSFVGVARAQTPAEVTAKIVDAGEALLATLDKTQQEALLFTFEDEEQRRRWSNLPTGIVKREGLRMGDLNESQKQAVFNLLAATLSESGMQQVRENMEGEELLRTGSGGRLVFGKDEYYISILGKPSRSVPWMWQFGGHHLGINATIVGEKVTLSPSLTGGQPVDYTFQGKAVRQLAGDEDKAWELVSSLSDEQRKAAVVSDTMSDMLHGPGKDAVKPKAEGISAEKLTPEQKKLLLSLVEERIGLLNSVHAAAPMKAIESNVDQLWFAWYGPVEQNAAASFRIIGPSVIIEYCPQRMGGSATQHTHAMYRDPTNDYGSKWVNE